MWWLVSSSMSHSNVGNKVRKGPLERAGMGKLQCHGHLGQISIT